MSSKTMRTALFVVATLLASFGPGVHAADRVCNVERKKVNLNFSAKDINGKDVRLSQFKGQVVLVNFWATWCVPCRREIPSLTALYRDYKDRGFVVLGVSVDKEVRLIKPFARTMKMNYPVLIGAGHEEFSEAFGPFIGFPTSVILERDGTACVRHIGLPSRSLLETQIDALLSG
ncbi:MAG TPA: TlpA disulfide reductase family protein [Steroidobacteraceae bacterium]|nr:TlpA disulfide reductase family protein [Steroidobacteraceae bacterium]